MTPNDPTPSHITDNHMYGIGYNSQDKAFAYDSSQAPLWVVGGGVYNSLATANTGRL